VQETASFILETNGIHRGPPNSDPQQLKSMASLPQDDLFPDGSLPSFPIHLLWLPGADRTPVLPALIDQLVEGLAT